MGEPLEVVYEHRQEYEERKKREFNQIGDIIFWILSVVLIIAGLTDLRGIEGYIITILGVLLFIFMWKTRRKK
jgi:uncharacterized Tic20 family protein